MSFAHSELLAGSACGLVQTFVGYPLDTVTVRLQNNYNVKLGNILSYYKGIGYPCIFNVISNGAIFKMNKNINDKINNQFISGFATGMVFSPFIYIFDTGKIFHQTNDTSEKITFSRFLKINGLMTTMIKESVASSFYFGIYNKLNKHFHPILSGSIAGVTSLTCIYPIDVIKTRQMTHNISFIDSYKMNKLWKGYWPCAIRACIVNGLGFYTYELTKWKFL
jgi:hypothetical protein